MKADFDMPVAQWRSFLLAAALAACVFAILPLSIVAGRNGRNSSEVSAVRAIPIKALPVGEAAKSNPPSSGIPALRALDFGDAHSPLRFAEPNANPDFSSLAVSAPGLPGDFSGNFEFADFKAVPASPEAVTFELSELDRIPRRIFAARAKYPPELLKRGIEGEVRLSVLILEDGSVEVEGVERSTDSRFEACAIEAASALRFESPTKNGKAARARFILPVPFRILK